MGEALQNVQGLGTRRGVGGLQTNVERCRAYQPLNSEQYISTSISALSIS
jgi:hypothetical protein